MTKYVKLFFWDNIPRINSYSNQCFLNCRSQFFSSHKINLGGQDQHFLKREIEWNRIEKRKYLSDSHIVRVRIVCEIYVFVTSITKICTNANTCDGLQCKIYVIKDHGLKNVKATVLITHANSFHLVATLTFPLHILAQSLASHSPYFRTPFSTSLKMEMFSQKNLTPLNKHKVTLWESLMMILGSVTKVHIPTTKRLSPTEVYPHPKPRPYI